MLRSRSDAVKAFIADLARPFAIYATSGAAAIATVRIAWDVNEPNGGAVLLTAVYAGVGALYLGKAWENQRVQGQNAEVEKERARSTPPPGTAQITAAADVDVTVRDATADPGELPPEQRVQR